MQFDESGPFPPLLTPTSPHGQEGEEVQVDPVNESLLPHPDRHNFNKKRVRVGRSTRKNLNEFNLDTSYVKMTCYHPVFFFFFT